MAQISFPPAPNTTPVFQEINGERIRNLLRTGGGGLIRFIIADVWSRWFTVLQTKVNPIVVTATLNFPNTLAQTSSDLTVAVNGAATDLHAEVVAPAGSILADSMYWAFVSAANVVTVRFCNFSAAAQNPASGVFVIIIRP